MKISIIGCGWLGLPLAEHLIAKNYEVYGSTTRAAKLPLLEEKGIIPIQFNLDPMPSGTNFNQLFRTDVLIVNIPPKSSANPPIYYREQIKYLKYQLQSSAIKKVIFISSTSYYPNTNTDVNEHTLFDLEKGSNQAVVYGEKEISSIPQQLCILRCGGLMGKQRIPGKWHAGKATKGAHTPVNYIHLDDVIATICTLINLEQWPEVQNLVYPQHPHKKEIAEAMAEKHSFQPPQWLAPDLIPFKKVKSLYETGHFRNPYTY